MILYVVIVTLSYIGLKKNNKKYASVAQLVEHLICTQAVEGSTPFRSSLVPDQEPKTWVASNCSHLNRRLAQFVSSGGILKTYFFWGYRIVAIAADCKSAPYRFGGSSPSTPTPLKTAFKKKKGDRTWFLDPFFLSLDK